MGIMMKKVLLPLLCFLFFLSGNAQESSSYLQKVKTIDSSIEALYDVISGPKGQQRDWDFFWCRGPWTTARQAAA